MDVCILTYMWSIILPNLIVKGLVEADIKLEVFAT